MSFLILDIETIPDGKLIKKIIYANEKNLTNEQAIEKYQQQILQETNNKSNFIPYTFHIPISIGIILANNEGAIEKLTTLDRGQFRPHEITKQFWKSYEKKETPLTLVTFNGRGFDLPVLELSAFRYGIAVPKWFGGNALYEKPRYRYSTQYHLDIMEFMTNYGSTRFTGGLNLLAILLSKPGKMQTKGSEVYNLWQQGRTIDIDDYCLCDTLDTYFVFLRLRVLTGKMSLEKEKELVTKARSYIEQSTNEYSILKLYLKNFTFWENPYQ